MLLVKYYYSYQIKKDYIWLGSKCIHIYSLYSER